MPKLRTENFSGGDMSWLGSSHGIGNARTGTLKISGFVAATHYPNGYIPSGTPVNVASESAVVPYVDGAGAKLGFVLTDQQVVAGSGDIAAPILRHGMVIAANLPGAAFTPPATGSSAGFTFVGGA